MALDVDGSRLGIYRKFHILDFHGYYENFYFIPGYGIAGLVYDIR